MNIRFVTPPIAKQVGGVENAVEGLREALHGRGVKVYQGGNPSDVDSLHHFHGLWNPMHSHLAAKLRRYKRPYIVSSHGMLEPWAFKHRRWKKIPYFWLRERRFLYGAKSIFVTSILEKENLSRVINHPNIKVLSIGCRDRKGVAYESARDSLGWRKDEQVMIFLSRIDEKKGLDLLLQSLAEGGFDWKGWKLVVIGDGSSDYLAYLKSIASKFRENLPEVQWQGPVWGRDRWFYIQGADLFCLTTHSENFGIAVLEALHAGTPVITTDQTPWGAYSELDGMFIAKPDVRSIQRLIITARERLASGWFLKDRELLADWADDNFAWGNIVEGYENAYNETFLQQED